MRKYFYCLMTFIAVAFNSCNERITQNIPDEEEPSVPEIKILEIAEGTLLAASGTASPIGSESIETWMAFQFNPVDGNSRYVYKGWLNKGTFFCFGNNTVHAEYIFCAAQPDMSFGEHGGEFDMEIVTPGTADPSAYYKWNVTDEGYYEIVLDCAASMIKVTYICDAVSAFSNISPEKLYMNVRFNTGEDFGIRADQMIEMEKIEDGIFRTSVSVPADKSHGQFRCQIDIGGHKVPFVRPSDGGKNSVAECDEGLEKTQFVFTTDDAAGFYWLHTDTPGHSYVITVDLGNMQIWAERPPLESRTVRISGLGIAGCDFGQYMQMNATDDPYVHELEVMTSGDGMITIYLDSDDRSLIPLSDSNDNLVIGEKKFKYHDGEATGGWFTSQIPAGNYKLTVNLRNYTLTAEAAEVRSDGIDDWTYEDAGDSFCNF